MASNSSRHQGRRPPSRLDKFKFKCTQPNSGYEVDGEWVTEDENYPGTHYFDVATVLASKAHYERFVSQVRGPCKVPFPNGDVFLCGGNGRHILQINGSTEDQPYVQVHSISPPVRFVFTPSFSRYQPGRSQCLQTLGKKLLECVHTVGVLMVREDEFSSYHERFGKEWFVMAPVHVPCNEPEPCPCSWAGGSRDGCEGWDGGLWEELEDARHTPSPQATIGQARHSIMNVALCWDLERIWMIDDSVPVDILQKCITSPQHHQLISMLEVLKEVETFAVTKKDGEGDAGPLALIGIPSTFSVESSGTFVPQWNHRAATSFVYVMLQEFHFCVDDINYDPRLPYKEDVIFSARLIEAGNSVCIYHPIHFKDEILDGGCQQYRQV